MTSYQPELAPSVEAGKPVQDVRLILKLLANRSYKYKVVIEELS